jgi:hypothetical protein
MKNTAMNPRILALLSFARHQELELVAGLSEAARNATGTPDSWGYCQLGKVAEQCARIAS